MPIIEALVALSLLAGLLLSVEGGYQFARKAIRADWRTADSGSGAQAGAILGATLGLLGLLLGFSFAGAAGRYIERQDLITAEANAISTAYLRADLLAEPYADDLRTALREYVADRVRVSATLHIHLDPQILQRVAVFHDRIWRAASDGVQGNPSLATPVLNPVNDVLDLHASRLAAGRKHLPALVLGLLGLCAVLAMGCIGYGCGLVGRRNLPMTVPLAILIGAALWTTIDLDYARIGLIRVSDQALADLDLR